MHLCSILCNKRIINFLTMTMKIIRLNTAHIITYTSLFPIISNLKYK